MSRAKHADMIIAWANGEEIQTNDIGNWREFVDPSYIFIPDCEYRIKPKEPEWWENIPEHGVLCWLSDLYDYPRMYIGRVLVYRKGEHKNFWLGERGAFRYATPLTNEEIESFLR